MIITDVTCDICKKKYPSSEFNTEVRIAPIDEEDNTIWGRIKICSNCRDNTTVTELYKHILGVLYE